MSWIENRVGLVALAAVAAACSAEAESKTGAGAAQDPAEGQEAAPRASRGPQVVVSKVVPATFVDRLNVNATVKTQQDIVLSARADGTVLRMAELGERVKDGQVVALLDPELAQAQLAQSQANLEATRAQAALAKETYERQKPLFEREVISALEFQNLTSQFQQTKAAVAQAEAQVRASEEQLARTRIRAPFGGTVEERYVQVGEQVSPGSQVLRIVNSDVVKVRGAVPERYAKDIQAGAEARVRFNAYGLEPRTGPVRFVGRAIDPSTRTFAVEVELSNEDGELKPEMVARIELTRATIEDALVVPQNAVLTDDRGESVFVVVREGEQIASVERRRVQTGVRSQGRVVISKGLSEGDEVVVVGQANINTGDQVTVAPITDLRGQSSP